MSGDGQARIIRGNALALPLADASVDLICTSPPYFGLRSYTDGGEHYAGQLGSETTPAEFVDALIAATREMVRVLKPSGSIWVNLGDKYSSGNGGDSNLTALGQRLGTGGGQKSDKAKVRSAAVGGMRPKSLIGIPWRYALRCIDDLGLILRAEVIWSKPNGLPESVTDRVRRSHENWFHLTVQPRYFSAVDEIREEHVTMDALTRIRTSTYSGPMSGSMNGAANPLGKLPGSVWTIPTQPLQVPAELGVDHFAAFPMEFPRRIIQGWSPKGVCTACGEGRRPVAAKGDLQPAGHPGRPYDPDDGRILGALKHGTNGSSLRQVRDSAITGYACACPEPTAPTTPSTVLDPFGGTGTVALMAKALGRTGISVDMSADYSRLATWRVNDPGQMAAALQVEKPEPVSPDQLDLFGGVA